MSSSRRWGIVAVLAVVAVISVWLVLRAPGMPLGGPPVVTTTVVTTELSTTPATVTETEGFIAEEGLGDGAEQAGDEPVGDLNSVWTSGDIADEDARLVRDEFIRGFLHDGNTERPVTVYFPSRTDAETFFCARDVDVVRCDGAGAQVFIA